MIFAPFPPGKYRLIYADPPWAFRTHAGNTRTPTAKQFNEAEDHYPTVPLDQLKLLPVADLADRDALLAMWIVGSHGAEALELAHAWGFTFVTDLFYWIKLRLVNAMQMDLFTGDVAPPPMSMGYYTRKQLEPVWLFKRGKGCPVQRHDVRQLIIEPKGEHSRKPEEAARRLDHLFGPLTRADGTPARIELFSRTTRPGWHHWGNEVGKFEGELV